MELSGLSWDSVNEPLSRASLYARTPGLRGQVEDRARQPVFTSTSAGDTVQRTARVNCNAYLEGYLEGYQEPCHHDLRGSLFLSPQDCANLAT